MEKLYDEKNRIICALMLACDFITLSYITALAFYDTNDIQNANTPEKAAEDTLLEVTYGDYDSSYELLEIDDYMTAVDARARGLSMPSYDNVWNVYRNSYTDKFMYDSTLFSNYNFTGKETIKISVDSKSSDSNYNIKDFTTGLYKRNVFGNSYVGAFLCKRDGFNTASFRVTSSDRYYVYLSKATDKVTLSGTVTVS